MSCGNSLIHFICKSAFYLEKNRYFENENLHMYSRCMLMVFTWFTPHCICYIYIWLSLNISWKCLKTLI